jgi:LL-H family phage holin
MLNELVFNVCLALVVGICGVIAHELIPYLHEKTYEAMKALEATKWAWAVDIINEVVRAVEQTVLEEHGDEKKAIAKQLIYKAMKEANIYLNDEQIDMLIEAAVHAMNGEKAICE